MNDIPSMSNGVDQAFYSDLMRNWKGFQDNIQDQINHVMRDQQAFVSSFSSRWMDRSGKIGRQIYEMSKGGAKEYQELYNIWKNYQNRINARIIKVTNIQNNGYSELIEKWETSRIEMMKILTTLRDLEENHGKEGETQVDLYSSWLNVTNSVTSQISMAMTQGNAEYQRLTKVWFEFLDNMKQVITGIPVSNPNYESIMKTWERISLEMGSELSNLISESNKHLKTVQSTWQEATNQIQKDLSKVFKEINYEELYTGFFDRTAIPTFGIGVPALGVNNRMEDEIKRLKARVAELEDQLKEIKK